MVDTNTVVEGTVKFRDGKKWKSRWCVMRKLSPVADCLHLQLYRDSKDRYKQGQTKASLSLQHFLGLQSGFTLDKESNTIAIICQDVTVVLAFDTRERLIQWQVKIANNLGEDEQFLVQIQSAPARGKVPPGPARLHIQEHRFSMTVGVPPRLVGYWLIRQLRRYGVVENRFCFEGGSRCGRGEGLYVLVSDQGEDIARAFQLAAEGKLASRRRPLARNSSVMDSPRRTLQSRADTRMSDVSCLESLLLPSEGCCGCHNNEESVVWPSNETRADSCDYGDANSVTDYQENHLQESCRTADSLMGRCTSCISKLGALSRSSTVTNTPGSGPAPGFTPAWTMDLDESVSCGHDRPTVADGYCNSAQSGWVAPSECWSSGGSSSSTVAERCSCCPPVRPPKPLQLAPQPLSSTNSPTKKSPKPPMPLPFCNCPHHQNLPNPYDNYDVPKTLPMPQSKMEDSNRCDVTVSGRVSVCPTADDYYDTPKNLKESLIGDYGNYDTPPPPATAIRRVTPCLHHSYPTYRTEKEKQNHHLVCPCHRVACWAESFSHKPQHREIMSPVLQRVKHSTDGRISPGTPSIMPIYATVDKSKKTNCKHPHNFDEIERTEKENKRNSKDDQNNSGSCNYANIKVIDPNDVPDNPVLENSSSNTDYLNYTNLEFAQSLEHYENSKDLLLKAGITPEEIEKMLIAETETVGKNGVNFCTKCGHSCSRSGMAQRQNNKQDDYLMMEPSLKQNSSQDLTSKLLGGITKQFPGYLPMHPVTNTGCFNKQDLLKQRLQREIGEKSSSTPSLTASISEACRKRLESDIQRVPGSAMLGINHSVSAANSPYLRRRVMGCITDTRGALCNSIPRKRSSSADSTKYLNEIESVTERTVSTSTTRAQDTLSTKNGMECTSSQSIQMKNECVENNSSSCKQNTNNITANVGSDNKSLNTINVDETQCGNDQSDSGVSVNVRRSSSVPCKSGHNRDSSSSNDSGVSIASLKQRGGDFVEFELPLTTSMSSRRHHHAVQKQYAHYTDCYHSSLPRRSKSVDPLRELTFQFQHIDIPLKSSSAEAEIPICLVKRDSKGCTSPGSALPYIDSRSTSSGTSDMSDYIETLSLSSYSSSDNPDCLQLGRPAATTLRPRSGREYHKIDRYILESDEQNTPYNSITSVVEKSESPSPGYVSSSPGQ